MNQDYIASTIQVDIPSFSEKYIDQKSATIYEIHLINTYSNQKWVMEKEFGDFEILEQNMNTIIANLPELEGKSMFKVTAYDEINRRKYYLLNFLRSCCVRKDIISNSFFNDFLDLDKHSPELAFNSQVKLSEYNEFQLGIQEFFYLEAEQVMFVSCSDMNLASRIDATITNLNLPWEKKTEAHISIGALFIFKTTFDDNYGLSFNKVFAKSFPEQVGAINYENEGMTINIGLNNGRIIFYKIKEESEFTQFESMCEFKPHKDKVTGISYDAKSGYIYSCSLDKKFIACDINYLESPSEVTEGVCGYTRLIHDKKNERIFLGTDDGNVAIYLTTNFPPTLVNMVLTTSEHSIQSIWVDYKKYYLFTVSQNGLISILELGAPKKEKFIKEISYFGGGVQLTSIVYHSKANEIITGDKNGRIAIWSLRKGESIYAWEGHSSGITHLYFNENSRILISSGEDNSIKTWKLPEKWLNEDVQKFEENEIRIMSDTMAMIKLQKSIERPEDYNSDEDSLNGWDYFP